MPLKKNIVCPSCSRRFATQAALAQHKSSSHSAARKVQPNKTRPSRVPRVAAGLRIQRAFGTDLVHVVQVNAGTLGGSVMINKPIVPENFEETRFALEASLWARWRPKRLQLKIQPAGNAFVIGSFTVGWSADPTLVSSVPAQNSAYQNMHTATSLVPQVSGRFSKDTPLVLNIPMETSRKWYQTNGEIDQCAHGCLFGVITAKVSGFTGSFDVTFSLAWDVEFEGIDSPAIINNPSVDFISPDNGWFNLFTTSDSSFDSSVLTFKQHSGGSMVPFSAAKHGVVYGPASGTTVKYFDSSSVEKECKYFVKVDTYSVPGLLLFASYEKATSYVKTADITEALPYTKAGNFSTPSVPRFRPVLGQHVETLEIPVDILTKLVEALAAPSGSGRNAGVTHDQDVLNAVRNIRTTINSMKKITVDLTRGENALNPLYVFNDNPLLGTSSITDSFEEVQED